METLEKLQQRKSEILEKIKTAEEAEDSESLARLKSELSAVEKQIETYDSPENRKQGFQQEPLIGYNYLKIDYPPLDDEGEKSSE